MPRDARAGEGPGQPPTAVAPVCSLTTTLFRGGCGRIACDGARRTAGPSGRHQACVGAEQPEQQGRGTEPARADAGPPHLPREEDRCRGRGPHRCAPAPAAAPVE